MHPATPARAPAGHAARWRPPGAPGRWALFLDVDGTLVELAARPELARARGGIRALLRRVRHRLGGALAIVSGRRLCDIDRLLGNPTIPAAGQHGAELRLPGGRRRDLPVPAALATARAALAASGLAAPPLLVEDKGATIAVHWRAAPALAPALRRALAELAPGRGPLALLTGHAVFELRPRDAGKHVAVAALMAMMPFRGRLPIFVGDDVTDQEGFVEVERRGGYAVQVTRHARATPGLFLRSPAEVRAWLRFLVSSAAGPADATA